MKKILLLLTVLLLNFNSFAAVDDPVMPMLPDLWACSNQPIFDFNPTTSIIFSAQVLPASNYTVTYHLTAADADAGMQEIASPWAYFGWDGQVIWARVTKNATNTFAVGSFSLLFFPPQIPVFNSILPVCVGSVAPVLPITSTNGISGTWSPSTINTAFAGTNVYTFTPNFGGAGVCSIPVTMTVTITNCDGLEFYPFIDTNSNGIKDSGEIVFPYGQFQYEMNNNGTINFGSSPSGIYTVIETDPANSYNVNFSIPAPYNSYFNATTASYTNIHITAGSGLTTFHFPVITTGTYADLAVDIIPLSSPRPGFEFSNRIAYTNYSNQVIAAGGINFQRSSAVSITSISQSGTTPVPNGFDYAFTNLQPFETRYIDVSMQVPNIPTVSLGQLLTNTATAFPIVGDLTPLNNVSTETQAVIGSYDPNDKTESHRPQIVYATYNNTTDNFNYTIRFENTGTANAINVRVEDVLDSIFDEATVQTTNASHPYVFKKTGSNLEWKFNNIQLPPSVINTNTGHGYISFKVKLKPSYAIGDVMNNTASIFFDFNPAIVTNTVQREFVTQLGQDEFSSGSMMLYPNPTSGIAYFDNSNATFQKAVVYNSLGQQLGSKQLGFSTQEAVDLSSLSIGIYLIHFSGSNGTKLVKVVKE